MSTCETEVPGLPPDHVRNDMSQPPETAGIRDKLVLKTVRNIRNMKTVEDAGKGMYRPGIKLDLNPTLALSSS